MSSFVISTEEVDMYRQAKASTGEKRNEKKKELKKNIYIYIIIYISFI